MFVAVTGPMPRAAYASPIITVSRKTLRRTCLRRSTPLNRDGGIKQHPNGSGGTSQKAISAGSGKHIGFLQATASSGLRVVICWRIVWHGCLRMVLSRSVFSSAITVTTAGASAPIISFSVATARTWRIWFRKSAKGLRRGALGSRAFRIPMHDWTKNPCGRSGVYLPTARLGFRCLVHLVSTISPSLGSFAARPGVIFNLYQPREVL